MFKKRKRVKRTTLGLNESDSSEDLIGERQRARRQATPKARRTKIAATTLKDDDDSQLKTVKEVAREVDSSDSEDLFDERKRAQEEVSLQERRARIVATAVKDDGDTLKIEKFVNGNNNQRPSKRPRAEASPSPTAAPVFDMFAPGAEAPIAGGVGPLSGVDAPLESEGYARVRPGETLKNGKYLVAAELGRGVFASVVRATEVATGRLVAIKLSRANAVMRRAAQRELATLRHVHSNPSNRGGIVAVLDDFIHREHHVAIVFECLSSTIRDIVRLHTSGIRLAAVRVYASQLIRALALLVRADVVHADVKPDNVLLTADRSQLFLADFGCALRKEHRTTSNNPYLAARFYRAPETILGYPPAAPIDIWAAACVLHELYTGRVAFAGATNNAMLSLFLDTRGSFSARVLRRAPLRSAHFDDDGRFLARDEQGVRVIPRRAPPKVSRIRNEIMTASAGDDERIHAPLLADLIEAMFTIDPAKRITPNEALRHPFFNIRKHQATPISAEDGTKDRSK